MTTAGKTGSWLSFNSSRHFSKMLGKGVLFPSPFVVFLFLIFLRFSLILSDVREVLIYQDKSAFLMRVACQTAKGDM